MDAMQLPQQDAKRAADFLKSLANPHRLHILCSLANGEMNVGELMAPSNLSPSSFSQHLAVLRKQGLIDFRKEAQTLFYSIKDPDTMDVIQLLKQKFCPDL
ncbi:metalloregulator ArsR/SmtB family transcription factor [Alteromonadaceae bacterium BrNp21-10]|nr:metalloregulator ArsR/SmtB family transcription factor [Alteromonadaceae bacterium BrNp21-10]